MSLRESLLLDPADSIGAVVDSGAIQPSDIWANRRGHPPQWAQKIRFAVCYRGGCAFAEHLHGREPAVLHRAHGLNARSEPSLKSGAARPHKGRKRLVPCTHSGGFCAWLRPARAIPQRLVPGLGWRIFGWRVIERSECRNIGASRDVSVWQLIGMRCIHWPLRSDPADAPRRLSL